MDDFLLSPYYFVIIPRARGSASATQFRFGDHVHFYENLQRELYDRYFLDASDFFRASKDELEYIQSLGPLRVLFFTGNAPFQYVQDGQLKGFAVEYFDDLPRALGCNTRQ